MICTQVQAELRTKVALNQAMVPLSCDAPLLSRCLALVRCRPVRGWTQQRQRAATNSTVVLYWPKSLARIYSTHATCISPDSEKPSRRAFRIVGILSHLQHA